MMRFCVFFYGYLFLLKKLYKIPEPTDIINSVQGIGGSETVIEKKIDAIEIDNVLASDFCIQIGTMNYGIEIDAIIGLDLLTACETIMDLNDYILTANKD